MQLGGTTKRVLAAGFGFVMIAFTCYFAYSALQGDTGLVEQVRLTRERAELESRLADLQAERRRLENLNHRLSERYLDLDLLDERARAVLGYIRDDEIVIR